MIKVGACENNVGLVIGFSMFQPLLEAGSRQKLINKHGISAGTANKAALASENHDLPKHDDDDCHL